MMMQLVHQNDASIELREEYTRDHEGCNCMYPPTMCCKWVSRSFLRVIIFSMTGAMFVILVLDEGVLILLH